jgi:hypothetical protein
MISVKLDLVIDTTVPTYGEVKPGSTGYGGPAEDARNPVSTDDPDVAPTSTPTGGRVQR